MSAVREPAAPPARPTTSETARLARIALWLMLSLCSIYLLLTRGHFLGTDEIAVYQATRSLWEFGDLRTGGIVNTFVGRGGYSYSVFSVGQSFAALPLYALAQVVQAGLEALGQPDWVRTFAGPTVGNEPSRWGGDIQIFFVNLFNAFTIPLLCGVFFAFSLRLGASVRASVVSAVLLGLTSYVMPSATNFLQHGSEALFLLWTFYFLFCDARRPSGRTRAWAGVTMALAIAMRWESVIALPWLGLYLLWSVWERRDEYDSLAEAVLREVPPFALPVLAGLSVPLIANWVRFESLRGHYGDVGFNSPFPTGLYTFLFSPGASIFLFTPLLVLLGRTIPPFVRAWRREAILIAALCLFYLFFYASYHFWHGLWSDMGPRFLVATIPFLLLPLAGWMDTQRPRTWLLLAPLALIGLWVQFVHVAANFSYVGFYERYIVPMPQVPIEYLFVPSRSPVLAHTRAVFDWDYRVDLWLVNTYRDFGLTRMLALAIPLLSLLGLSVWRLVTHVREMSVVFPRDEEIDFSPLARPAAVVLGGIVSATLLAYLAGF